MITDNQNINEELKVKNNNDIILTKNIVIKEYDSIYSKSFYSNELNIIKYNAIKNKAKLILNFKNEISIAIHNDLNKFVDMSTNDLIVYFNKQIKGLTGQDIQHAIKDVAVCYSNKFEQIKKKFVFKIQDELICIKYKKNGKNFKKGDTKYFEVKLMSTSLSKVMTYLAKYGDINQIIYSENKLPEFNEQLLIKEKELENKEKEINISKIEQNKILNQIETEIKNIKDKIRFHEDIIKYCNKFGLDRILKLALNKRERIYKRYNEMPIIFKSISFKSISRVKQNIVDWNKNRKSIINAFICLGGFIDEEKTLEREEKLKQKQEQKNNIENIENIEIKEQENKRAERVSTKSLYIPIKYSKEYHGEMHEYLKENNLVSYTVCFEKNRIRIVLTKVDKRQIVSGGTNLLGADLNVKHNLFKLSTNEDIDYDRNLMSGYVKFLTHLDEKKQKKNKNDKLTKKEKSSLSREDKKHYDRWNLKISNMFIERCSSLIRYAKENNYNHLILEDLEQFGKIFSRDEEFEGFKYSRLCNMLNLVSLKDIIKNIAYKHNISVSFVQAHYTSQQCSRCGHTDKANRKTQEIFRCTQCELEINADLNAALNILNRVFSDVLRKSLLKETEYGELIPKLCNKYIIKEELLTHSCENTYWKERSNNIELTSEKDFMKDIPKVEVVSYS